MTCLFLGIYNDDTFFPVQNLMKTNKKTSRKSMMKTNKQIKKSLKDTEIALEKISSRVA